MSVCAKLFGMLLAIATILISLVNYLRSYSEFQKRLRIAAKIVEDNSNIYWLSRGQGNKKLPV